MGSPVAGAGAAPGGGAPLTALVFICAFALLLRGAAPGIAGDDTAELILASRLLDLTHPPGYPLLALAGRLFQLLPVGGGEFRMTILSVALGAGCVALLSDSAGALLAGLGRRSTVARANAAVLALGLGAFLYQSTQAEKYVLHLFLSLTVVRTFLSTEPRPYALPFTWGLALAHHPMALFLAPLLWRARKPLSSAPAFLIAVFLVLVPVSLKVAYPAIRTAASRSDARLVAWGRPDSPRRLARYLTVAQYRERFGRSPGGFAARIAPQLRRYPAETGAVALAAGLAGAFILARAAPAIALPLLAVIPLQWLLAGSFSLHPWLTSQYHVMGWFLLTLFAAVLPAFMPCLLGPLFAAILLVSGALRIGPALEAERKDGSFATLDANRVMLALAPPRSYLFAGTDSDLFPLRWLQSGLGLRPDVTVLDAPFQSKLPAYREYLERAAPELVPPVPGEFTPWDTLRAVLRRVPPGRCAVFSGYLESFFPGVLSFTGPLAVHAARPCTIPGGTGIWFRLPSRSLLARGADRDREYAVLGLYETALAVEFQRALAGRRFADATRFASLQRTLFPGRASGWLETAALKTMLRDPWGARQAYEAAIARDPGELAAYAELALLLEAMGDAAALRILLLAARPALSLGPAGELERADRALAGNDPRAGALILNGVLARRALAEAERLLAEPGTTGFRAAGPRAAYARCVIASHLRPDWPEPRALLEEIRRQTGSR